MRALFGALAHALANGDPVAIATITGAVGPVSRGPGAKMAVCPEGVLCGTVGGGAAEMAVCDAAREVLTSGQPKHFVLPLPPQSETGPASAIELLIDPWQGPVALELARRLDDLLAADRPLALVTVLAAHGVPDWPPGRKLLIADHPAPGSDSSDAPKDDILAAGRPQTRRGRTAVRSEAESRCVGSAPSRNFRDPAFTSLEDDIQAAAWQALQEGSSGFAVQEFTVGVEPSPARVEVLIEVVQPPLTLLLVGAGHIAQPLATIAALLDYEVVVLDHRPALLNAERFPGVQRLLLGDPISLLRDYPLRPRSQVVIVAPDHQQAFDCLRIAIASPARYVGMVASRQRAVTARQSLSEEGVTPEQLVRLHCPIGLRLGAQTPAEIAVSIAAELVQYGRAAVPPAR